MKSHPRKLRILFYKVCDFMSRTRFCSCASAEQTVKTTIWEAEARKEESKNCRTVEKQILATSKSVQFLARVVDQRRRVVEIAAVQRKLKGTKEKTIERCSSKGTERNFNYRPFIKRQRQTSSSPPSLAVVHSAFETIRLEKNCEN